MTVLIKQMYKSSFNLDLVQKKNPKCSVFIFLYFTIAVTSSFHKNKTYSRHLKPKPTK